MAHRAARKTATSAAEQPSAAEDLAALHPEIALTIAGRKVVMREYGFFEGMEVAHRASGFIADMREQCKEGSLRFAGVRRLFGVHRDAVVAIAAQAADVEPDWVLALGRADAERFMEAWFAVNAGFFVREVVVELQEQLRLQKLRTGSGSSPGSVPPASAPSSSSAALPSGS